MKTSERGAGLSLISSLRLRVTLATALTFVGLGVLVCLVLPRAYAEQAREGLRDRTRLLANAAAHQIRREHAPGRPAPDVARQLPLLATLLDVDPDFDGALLLDPDGNVIAAWPRPAGNATRAITAGERNAYGRTHYTAEAHVGAGRIGSIVVRTSTERVAADLESMRWLFGAIFVAACVSFWVLSRYLVSGIVDPLEEVRRAAMSLADGERYVPVPASGDREIDELGRYIDALGQKRRHSTLMPNPLLDYLRERSPVSEARRGDGPTTKG